LVEGGAFPFSMGLLSLDLDGEVFFSEFVQVAFSVDGRVGVD
jgi:hypothetical protein